MDLSCLGPLCALISGCAGEAMSSTGRLNPGVFELGEDCSWKAPTLPDVRMNAYYIAGPAPDQDRRVWLDGLMRYRQAVREGAQGQIIDMDYRGIRAWVRLAAPVSKALELKPGDRLRVSAEARHISGNDTLCVAFDVHNRQDDTKTGWTEVQGGMVVSRDSQWHSLETVLTVPVFDGKKQWLRPIFGMDATRDATPGRMEIRDLAVHIEDAPRMQAAERVMSGLGATGGRLDRRLYDRTDLIWASRGFTCHFTFMYDRSFYDPTRGQYCLDALLDDGVREFGGYDMIVLWQAYPRIGVDPRNQFDMYRDMPGGLDGIRALIRRAHERGVKVFIDYNPWDRGTRREGHSDEEALADLVARIEADGIFLDTMSAASPTLRQRLDQVRPGVVLAPEGHPNIEQLSQLNLSWAQWLTDAHPPGLLHLKWIEPRHMQHQIKRWDRTHQSEIETAFFNGSGMLVWENVFGTYNPWDTADRICWRRASAILRHFAPAFANDRWEPFVPTLARSVHAHGWYGDGVTLYTLLNTDLPLAETPLLEIPVQEDMAYFDLWNGSSIVPRPTGAGRLRLVGTIDRLGCLLAIARSRIDAPLNDLLARQQKIATGSTLVVENRNEARSVVAPAPVALTKRIARNTPPPGMILVHAASIRMKIEHMRRECGCYPDPETPQKKWVDFLWGSPFDGQIKHDIGPVRIEGFFIDEAAVTNADYQRFLDATGYRPKHSENFLRHWSNGKMPAELADHPVVWVDLDDARAFARWAGKRLPTESEWHLAAQGTDGRVWPWGNAFDSTRCNSTGTGTVPVRSHPTGRSPYGLYNMSGNVWEWTESVRDDGHTRFAILRGGSYFKAEGSVWYVAGGPQPCTSHTKFLLMHPGLDRCATIGFRCVADIE